MAGGCGSGAAPGAATVLRGVAATALVALAATAVIVLPAGPAAACTCSAASDPTEAYDAVFLGTAVAAVALDRTPLADPEHPALVTFTVEEVYRGAVGEVAEVAAGGSPGSCGYRFDLGERYLVAASRRAGPERFLVGPDVPEGALVTGACTLTTKASAADLGALPLPVRPVAGEQGLLDEDDGTGPWPWVAAGAVALLVLAGGVAVVVRRHAT